MHLSWHTPVAAAFLSLGLVPEEVARLVTPEALGTAWAMRTPADVTGYAHRSDGTWHSTVQVDLETAALVRL